METPAATPNSTPPSEPVKAGDSVGAGNTASASAAPAPRAAEVAVLDEVASLKKQMADLSAFVGFGVPKTPEPTPVVPSNAGRPPVSAPSWLNPWAAA